MYECYYFIVLIKIRRVVRLDRGHLISVDTRAEAGSARSTVRMKY